MSSLQVTIISPKKIVFSESVLSLSSINSLGKFDILPSHANFITLVENSPIIIRKLNEQIVTFKFPLAIVYTSSDKVSIYTDIQLPRI